MQVELAELKAVRRTNINTAFPPWMYFEKEMLDLGSYMEGLVVEMVDRNARVQNADGILGSIGIKVNVELLKTNWESLVHDSRTRSENNLEHRLFTLRLWEHINTQLPSNTLATIEWRTMGRKICRFDPKQHSAVSRIRRKDSAVNIYQACM